MPQSSPEMYKLVNWIIQSKLPLEIPNEREVEKFLEERGYKLNKNWLWSLPTEQHVITEMEMLCLRYLMEEWDYGGIEEVNPA